MKRNHNKRWIIPIVLGLLIFLTLAFLWGNSLQSVAQSSRESRKLLAMLSSLLEPMLGKGAITHHFLRKSAHMIEFTLLGILLSLFVVYSRLARVQAVVNCLFLGLCVAVADESLQLLSDRGSQVSDILLDFCGVVLGIAVVLIVRWIRLLIKK
ncbi:MAG: VanZ family protein [Intestinibacillus sp.]